MNDQATSLLIVVENRQPHLHTHLADVFAEQSDVRVVLDRRVVARRRQRSERDGDRRLTPRRARPESEAELRQLGWAVVRLGDR
jgi:hypothetical protein